MLLFSQDAEIRCIFTLLDSDIPDKVRATLLSNLSEDTFHYPPAKAAYHRISRLVRKRFELIDLEDLLEDPSFEEDFREGFKDAHKDYEPCTNKKQLNSMRETLEEYRKLRIVFTSCKSALEALQGDAVDIDEVMNKMSTTLAKARRTMDENQKILKIGKKTNAKSVVHNVLHKVHEELIKTGFTEYDERNGGLPEEGVAILAGTVSGGKSVLLLNLCKNIYLNSTKEKPRHICRVSFEMGEEQETSRLLSNLSGIRFFKFKQNKLSPQEKLKVKKVYKQFTLHGKKTGSQFDLMCPTRGMTIEDVFQMLKPYGYNVICIDYVSLLEGVDEDNQWRMLSAIVRQGKIYSRETRTLVIILAQLDVDTDKIRYSRGMKEHADVVWTWNYSKQEQREQRILPVKCDKARDAEIFMFPLAERFDIMRLQDVQQDGYETNKQVDIDTDKESNSDGEKDQYALS
jgi:replicative DNA helicase